MTRSCRIDLPPWAPWCRWLLTFCFFPLMKLKNKHLLTCSLIFIQKLLVCFFLFYTHLHSMHIFITSIPPNKFQQFPHEIVPQAFSLCVYIQQIKDELHVCDLKSALVFNRCWFLLNEKWKFCSCATAPLFHCCRYHFCSFQEFCLFIYLFLLKLSVFCTQLV